MPAARRIPKLPVRKLTSWSYSRFGTYSQCPLKAKLSIIDKIPEGPKNAAMERGAALHDVAEKYLKGEVARLPAEFKNFADLFKKLKAQRKKDPSSVIVEDMWAMTDKWGPTQWNNWAECWVRIKIDCAAREGNVVYVNDWKSGKFNTYNLEDYIEQLELYATGALLVFGSSIPDIVVRPRLVYLDANIIYPREGIDKVIEYTMADLPGLKKTWEKRTKAMLNDTTFAPRPNDKCKWCAYRAENGGPCKY